MSLGGVNVEFDRLVGITSAFMLELKQERSTGHGIGSGSGRNSIG